MTNGDGDELRAVVIRAARELAETLERIDVAGAAGRDDSSPSGVIDRAVHDALERCLARLAATGCWGPANRSASNELWRIAERSLARGRLQCQARTKPYGYAGDFELMDRIWRRIACPDPLGGAMDRYFLEHAAPRAVRTRIQMLADRLVERVAQLVEQDDQLVEREDRLSERDGRLVEGGGQGSGTVHAVSIGCGPAAELVSALERLPVERRGRIRATLLDLDPRALEFASSRLAGLILPGHLATIRTNLNRLPADQAVRPQIQDADFLYCAGLFDYLDDPAARRMLALFWNCLAAGGQLHVFHFTADNPSRAYMEWIGNWYLNCRDDWQLRRLATAAGIPDGSVRSRTCANGCLAELTAQRA